MGIKEKNKKSKSSDGELKWRCRKKKILKSNGKKQEKNF